MDSATNAIEMFHDLPLDGRRILVNYSKPRRPVGNRGAGAPSKTLFIGNLAYDMTDRDLNNLFSKIQNVIDVRVAIDRRTGQPRGFAHAEFIDVESAVKAKASLEDMVVCGRNLRLDFSATTKSTPPKTEE